MKTRRTLSPDERALWQEAVKAAEPLAKPHIQPPESNPARKIPQQKTALPSQGFRVGQKVQEASPAFPRIAGPQTRPGQSLPQMDKRNFDKLRKGKLPIDARIDLHGKTLSQAHPALTGFIRESHYSGKRLVLVITGKGTTHEEGWAATSQRGVLRQQVPDWLSRPPLSPLIVQVIQASRKHGGAGAYYVYLKRIRERP